MNDKEIDDLVDRVTKEKTGDDTPPPVAPEQPPAAPLPNNPPAPPKKADDGKPVATATPKANGPDELNFADIEIPDQLLTDKKGDPQPNAPPAQPAATPTEDEPQESKHWGAETRKAFASLRAKLNAAEDQIQKLKVATPPPAVDPNLAAQAVESATKHQQEVEALRAEVNKAYDLVSRISLEADPRFKAKYDVPRQAVFEQIKDIVKEWDVKDETVSEILKASPKRRIELANEISPDVLPLLAPFLATYDHTDKMRKMDLDHAKNTMADMEQARNQEAATKDKVGRLAMFKSAATKVLSDGHFVFRLLDGPGNEKWNKNVSALQAEVQSLFTKDDPMAQAEHLILGVAAPVYLALYRKEKARSEELQKQLKDNFGMRPALGGKTPEAGKPPRQDSDEASASDVVGSVMAEIRK